MRRSTSVTTPVAHLVGPGKLKVLNGHLAYSVPGEAPLRLDPMALTDVLCYGDVSVTGQALELLFRHGVQTAWMSPAGNLCRGRLVRADPPTTRTRVRQHEAFAQPRARLDWAQIVVAGKLDAMMQAARHHQRHGVPAAGPLLASVADFTHRLANAAIDEVRGLEGAASAAWFELLGQVLQAPWVFKKRSRRPPADPANALLSLAYTWLLNRTSARAEAAGFEIYLGGLHDYRPGRPSLACDLMEPLRVPLVDRWMLAVCNRREFTPDDFQPAEDGGFRLRPAVFGRTLFSWETHWLDQSADCVLQTWLDRLTECLRRWTPAPADSATQSEPAEDF